MKKYHFHVSTDYYDGPLSLILYLINREQLDIRKLDISYITDQYLDYLNGVDEVDFSLSGDYLYMAATLLWLKSRIDLGIDEVEDTEEFAGPMLTREQLIEKLIQLQRYQELGNRLWEKPRLGHDFFTAARRLEKNREKTLCGDLSRDDLVRVMNEVLTRESRRRTVTPPEKVSLRSKISFLKKALVVGETYRFNDLIAETPDFQQRVGELVVTFVTLLELCRLQKLGLSQREGGALYLEVKESIAEVDVEDEAAMSLSGN